MRTFYRVDGLPVTFTIQYSVSLRFSKNVYTGYVFFLKTSASLTMPLPLDDQVKLHVNSIFISSLHSSLLLHRLAVKFQIPKQRRRQGEVIDNVAMVIPQAFQYGKTTQLLQRVRFGG